MCAPRCEPYRRAHSSRLVARVAGAARGPQGTAGYGATAPPAIRRGMAGGAMVERRAGDDDHGLASFSRDCHAAADRPGPSARRETRPGRRCGAEPGPAAQLRGVRADGAGSGGRAGLARGAVRGCCGRMCAGRAELRPGRARNPRGRGGALADLPHGHGGEDGSPAHRLLRADAHHRAPSGAGRAGRGGVLLGTAGHLVR